MPKSAPLIGLALAWALGGPTSDSVVERRSLTTVMFANVWSKLPQHLLYCMIDNTDDHATLQNWCVATAP